VQSQHVLMGFALGHQPRLPVPAEHDWRFEGPVVVLAIV
jgi:hypothetical protein